MSHLVAALLATPAQARIVAGVFAALALLALRAFFVRLRRERLVAETPLMRIRSAAQGYVKVAGRAAPANPVPTDAPLSSRPCVWWSYEIAHRERDSRGNSRWSVVERATSTELFVLADEEGRCLVGPVQAEITPTTRDTWYGSDSRPRGLPVRSGVFRGSGDWRYTELLLSVDDRLSVLGDLRSHSEVASIDSNTAHRLKEWKRDQQALLARFDANRDGCIDATEWDAARAAAARESQALALSEGIEGGAPARIRVISKPAGGEPFLIAPLSSEAIQRREWRFGMLYLCAAVLSLVLCVWSLRHAKALSELPAVVGAADAR